MKLATTAFAAQAVARAETQDLRKLRTFDYTGVKLLDSRVKKQFQSARDFYFNIPNDNLLLGFRQRAGLPTPGKPMVGWYAGNPAGLGLTGLTGGDTYHAFGQYISGMSRTAKAAGDKPMRDKVNELVAEWAKTIEPDGFFYYSRRPNSYHYTYEKMVCGLVDAYAYCDNRVALHHLERITAWAEKNLDRTRAVPLRGVNFSADGQEWYTLSENLLRAFGHTSDPRYRTFAEVWRYTDYWGMFTGEVPFNPYGRHAYSHVNTFSSAAMTFAFTGDPAYLKTITSAYDWLQKTQVYATGGFGPGERLMSPDGSLGNELEYNANTFETVCGSWAIFKMGHYLITFTGDARYGDWMEKALYNGIGAALPMMPDGRNFYYSDYRLGSSRKIYNVMWKWSRCSGTYPQAIADYYNIIYFKALDSLFVNLYVPSEVDWEGVRLVQETAYPESPTSRFTLHMDSSRDFTLNFRLPGWCDFASLELNGNAIPLASKPGEWIALRRVWANGDRIAVTFPMTLSFAPVDQQHARRSSLVYGPVVLAKRQSTVLSAALSLLRRKAGLYRFMRTSPTVCSLYPFMR